MTETTRVLNRDQGIAYASCVPPRRPRRGVRQHTVGVDDDLWDDCTLIADEKRETLSAVMRGRLVGYREENRELLDSIKERKAADDPADQASS